MPMSMSTGALLQGPEIARRGKLLLAVSWSNPHVVEAMLNDTSGERPSEASGRFEGASTVSGGASLALDKGDITAAVRHVVTDDNKAVDPAIIRMLLDDRRMPCDEDGNPTLEQFPFQLLPIPSDANRRTTTADDSSTDDAWRLNLAARFPAAWDPDAWGASSAPLGEASGIRMQSHACMPMCYL